MTYANPDALVSTDWLADHLDDRDVRIVDGTSFLPNVPRNPREEFEAAHIPGAVLVDIEEVSDHDDPLPHMLPSPLLFSEAIGKLGIGNQHKVIVYDVMGVRTSPRIWWMFRVFGHDAVAVLDGGLPKWQAEERLIASGPERPAPRQFAALFRPELVRELRDMMANQSTRSELVVDARPAGRFIGTDAEPRPGLPSGHMPGAVSMPVERLVDPDTGQLLPAADIKRNFDTIGADIGEPAVTTCGSGVAACTVSLGYYLLGAKNVPVYDGSWSEWGARDDTEKQTA